MGWGREREREREREGGLSRRFEIYDSGTICVTFRAGCCNSPVAATATELAAGQVKQYFWGPIGRFGLSLSLARSRLFTSKF